MKELTVISMSKTLVINIYGICRLLPEQEKYVLIPQMCRASISIPSNLVEGQQRGDKEFIRFIKIARGSLFELKIQLEICQDLYKNIEYNDTLHLIDQIGRMTYKLMLKLKADSSKIK